jgi:hypothetical protein
MDSVGTILQKSHSGLLISKQRLRQTESVLMVRLKRESGNQELGYSSRPFVLCGLPVKRPAKGTLLHERRNGRFLLQVIGHPKYGLPWAQDRLVPIFLATLATRQKSPRVTFPSAADMLDTFGMQQGGSQYRRLIAAFQRIFGATIFFGTDTQVDRAAVVHQARFNFMSEARIWYSRDPRQEALPGGGENVILLTDEFYREVTAHPIPTDLEAARALSCSPAALDLFTWVSYRCFTAKTEERIPLFGEFGLMQQLGVAIYSRPRRFRERLEEWLDLVRLMWPDCPAQVSQDGQRLVIRPGRAIRLHGELNACA